MADSLGMETMWGEATASSAPFYEKILRTRPVKDLFIIHRDTMRHVREFYLADQQSRLAKTTNPIIFPDVKRKLTPREWMDDILEYERTHEIAFASPRALLEARMIEAMDKARSPRSRARRNGVAPRRKAVTV